MMSSSNDINPAIIPTESLRDVLNSIIMSSSAEDVNDASTKARVERIRAKLHQFETPFNWVTDSETMNQEIYERAVNRKHQYTWEGYVMPFTLKMLQAYYAMCKNDRLVLIKCLRLAEKIIIRGERNGDYKLQHYIVPVRHIFFATVASVLYRFGIFTKAEEILSQISPMISMSRYSMAGLFYMKALTFWYIGYECYVESLKYTTYGLQRDPLDPNLRFMCLQLVLHLWNKELDKKLVQNATDHLKILMVFPSGKETATFEDFYRSTSWQRNVPIAMKNMDTALRRIKPDTTSKELSDIETAIVMNLEVEPYFAQLIGCAGHFFIYTNQPEKALFLQSISKLLHPENAYRWLDYRMLLYPETFDEDCYNTLVQYHHGNNSVKIYKRIAMHYVMFDPEKAFSFALKALAIENDHWVYEASKDTTCRIPIYDEKVKLFEVETGIGFYRFMVYYGHSLGSGEVASSFLWRIQEWMPYYLDSASYTEACQKIFDILLKNEFYRQPLRVNYRGKYHPTVIHCFQD